MLGLGAVSDPGVVGVGIFVADALPDIAAHTTLGEAVVAAAMTV